VKAILQPDYDLRLGDILNAALRDEQEGFHIFEAAVAFAKRSGVQYLVEGLRIFTESGGYVRMLVGIDHYGTTYEGLADLLDAIANHGELWIYHDSRKYITFHPKLYLFEGQTSAWLITGSGNLTGSTVRLSHTRRG
jgi:HKD family nuclease